MNRGVVFRLGLGVVVAGVLWAVVPVTGQDTADLTTPWPGLDTNWEPPRTPWGAPELIGIWDSKSSTPMQRPEGRGDRQFLTDEEVAALNGARIGREQSDAAQERDVRGERGTAADVEGAYNNIFSTGMGVRYGRHRRTSLIIAPPDGRFPPLTAEGAQRQSSQAQRQAARSAAAAAAGIDLPYFVDLQDRYDNPEDTGNLERCMGVTIPCTGGLCGFSRIVQGRDSVTIYYEQGHGGGAYRQIPIDDQPHLPSHVRQWLGDSIGHWDGDTLVVDTTNFTDQTSYMGSGENLHIIERFTRAAPDLLRYQITVEDETVWTEPWTMELALVLQDNVENLIFEAACHEGNYSLTGILTGARLAEAGGR